MFQRLNITTSRLLFYEYIGMRSDDAVITVRTLAGKYRSHSSGEVIVPAPNPSWLWCEPSRITAPSTCISSLERRCLAQCLIYFALKSQVAEGLEESHGHAPEYASAEISVYFGTSGTFTVPQNVTNVLK